MAKKTCFALFLSILACGILPPVFSFEGGGLIRSDTSYSHFTGDGQLHSTSNFSTTQSLSLWARQALNKNNTILFSVQGSYYFLYAKNIETINIKNSIHQRADLDLLKFSFLFPLKTSTLSMNVGRFSITDLTNRILNQQLDGTSLAYNWKYFSLFSHIGYTGLINIFTNPMFSAWEPKKLNEVYSPALYGFVSSVFAVHIPVKILYGAFDVELLGFFDPMKPSQHRIYFTGAFSFAWYNITFNNSFSVSKEWMPEVSYSGQFFNSELIYRISSIDMNIGTGISFADKYFQSFSTILAIKKFPLYYSNILKASLSIDYSPVKNLNLECEINTIFDGTSINYLGTEWTTEFSYKALQNVTISVEAGQIFFKDNLMGISSSLKGTLSF